MRCLSSPSETAFTGERPWPGLWVTMGAHPPSRTAAAAQEIAWVIDRIGLSVVYAASLLRTAMRLTAIATVSLLLAACGAPVREPATADRQPQARPVQPRVPAPRPDPASPEVRGKGYPECDPR